MTCTSVGFAAAVVAAGGPLSATVSVPSRSAAPQPDTAIAPTSTAAIPPPFRIAFMLMTVAAGAHPATWPRRYKDALPRDIRLTFWTVPVSGVT
ncbi:hypothetical protein Pa4123_67540 [Phytohabitans aurantiacus]|uniref:Secreted protein n=1 Tax=Phytohabitans aurantiacus TaxID=3016789 RepID=A0ABQ5R4J9_9ACTN|nr:hypothetical protein Pa4123_67540 [Phytohabitans aurantiacus]